jgi:hypothetical protein
MGPGAASDAARRGGPWLRPEVPETRVFRLAFRSWKQPLCDLGQLGPEPGVPGGGGGYHVFTLTSPDRLVIDVSHVALGKFPGIWDIASWPQYWATQYSWLKRSPAMAVQPVVRRPGVGGCGYGSASAVGQVNANTFKVTKPDGKTFTVTSVRPVSVPGPWVITKIA